MCDVRTIFVYEKKWEFEIKIKPSTHKFKGDNNNCTIVLFFETLV
jgi:hypothetical protein